MKGLNMVKSIKFEPHETFTHYVGQPTAPNQADSDPELQNYIIVNIKKQNYLIAQNQSFDLPICANIRINNEQNPKINVEVSLNLEHNESAEIKVLFTSSKMITVRKKKNKG